MRASGPHRATTSVGRSGRVLVVGSGGTGPPCHRDVRRDLVPRAVVTGLVVAVRPGDPGSTPGGVHDVHLLPLTDHHPASRSTRTRAPGVGAPARIVEHPAMCSTRWGSGSHRRASGHVLQGLGRRLASWSIRSCASRGGAAARIREHSDCVGRLLLAARRPPSPTAARLPGRRTSVPSGSRPGGRAFRPAPGPADERPVRRPRRAHERGPYTARPTTTPTSTSSA